MRKLLLSTLALALLIGAVAPAPAYAYPPPTFPIAVSNRTGMGGFVTFQGDGQPVTTNLVDGSNMVYNVFANRPVIHTIGNRGVWINTQVWPNCTVTFWIVPNGDLVVEAR